jgi:hypothetical protein
MGDWRLWHLGTGSGPEWHCCGGFLHYRPHVPIHAESSACLASADHFRRAGDFCRNGIPARGATAYKDLADIIFCFNNSNAVPFLEKPPQFNAWLRSIYF